MSPHPIPLPAGERDGVRGNYEYLCSVFDAPQHCCRVIHSALWKRLLR